MSNGMATRPCGLWDCARQIPRTRFMCSEHWRLVSSDLKAAVLDAWHRFRSAPSTTAIKNLGEIQEKAAASVQEELGRKLATLFACTSEPNPHAQVEARRACHDLLIDQLGGRRRSGVTWITWDAPLGLKVLEGWGDEYDGYRDYLKRHPDGCLIAATAWAEPEAS